MTFDQRTPDCTVPDPPRAVPRWFFLRRMRAMVFVGLLFIGLGAGMGVGIPMVFYFLSGRVSPTVDWALDRSHATTTAVITDKEFLAHTQVGSRSPWRVAFRFTTPGGVTVDAVGHTYDRSFATRKVGDSLRVEYDPADPSRARPVGGCASLLSLRLLVMIPLLIGTESVVGVAALVATWFAARRERVLLTFGASAEAEVVQVRRVRYIRFGAHNPYDVYYRFLDHLGREVTAKDRTYAYGWAEGLKPGDPVGVVYNPQSPTANVLWLHEGEAARKPQST
jgi:hypothetical protein